VIRSMTGFGKAVFGVDGASFDIEMRSVNHRHLDVRARLPRALSSVEAGVKPLVQQRLERGKVDITVSPSSGRESTAAVEIDGDVVAGLVLAARRIAEEHGLEGGVRVGELLALPGVVRLTERAPDPTDLSEAFDEGFKRALEALDEMRAVEGEALEREIRERLGSVGASLKAVEARAGQVVDAVRTKLRKRTEKLQLETGLIDEARLHQEIVIAADRLDITEEVVRLASHIEQFEQVLAAAGTGVAVGRRLDFLLQEMGRETNTIGSKASDSEIAHLVVELKTELERIREQVQNVE
jgi:uncharacterized protein (TIGR00255 family)